MSLGDVAAVILSKYPAPGRVKTRLCPALTPDQAAAVHRIFLLHLVRRLRDLKPAELFLCYDPPDARQAMASLFPTGEAPMLIPQVSGDLGHRLAAIATQLARQHRNLLIFAVDSPDLPSDLIRQVARTTATAQVTLGLADDGGYWCLGLTPDVNAGALLHEGIAWSTNQTAHHTLANARALNYRAAAGYPWSDVDSPQDLRNLMARLASSSDKDDAELHAQLTRELPPAVLCPA